MTTTREVLEADVARLISEHINGHETAGLGVHAAAKAVIAALSPVHTTQLENHVAGSVANQAGSVPQQMPYNDGHAHEAAHTAHVLADAWERHVCDSPCAARFPAVLAAADKAALAMAECYQIIGENWDADVEERASRLPREEQRGSPEWRPDPKTVEAGTLMVANDDGTLSVVFPDPRTLEMAARKIEGFKLPLEEPDHSPTQSVFNRIYDELATAIRSLNSQTSAEKAG